MRKMVIVMALVACLFNTGCSGKIGEYTMTGAVVGGALGTVVSVVLPEASPAVQTLASLGGAAIGGGVGYAVGKSQHEKELKEQQLKEQQAFQLQQAHAQQAQLQQLQQSTKLSAPVTIVIGDQSFLARNNFELANVLFKIQPGSQFIVRTKSSNVMAVLSDMSANGYIALGSPKPQKKGFVHLTFQKPGGQMTPLTMEQADKFL